MIDSTRWSSTPLRTMAFVVAGIVLCGVMVLTFASLPRKGGLWCWKNPVAIEQHLVAVVGLGSSEGEVLGWLSRNHTPSAGTQEAVILPGSDYPPSRIGGRKFIHKTIGVYGWPFEVDVEAFFIFDQNDRLVEIRVRKTVDAV
jgi:hypothetical protein